MGKWVTSLYNAEQRLILTHLMEKQHLGVLTGSPITDMKITLLYGRAHLRHTEGGDFRQATYRAVRQGLMCAEPVLLEPYYDFRVELPTEYLGRAMTDIRRMEGETDPPQSAGSFSILTGSAPVSAFGEYARELASYTRGQGRLPAVPGGYRPCRHADSVAESIGYDPEADTENTPDSIFCSHGAGYTVKWSEIRRRMAEESMTQPASEKKSSSCGEEEELMAIYERTYGPVKDRTFLLRRKPPEAEDTGSMLKSMDPGYGYLLVDGYNMIFSWEDLKALAEESMSLARETLRTCIQLYKAYKLPSFQKRM